MPELPEVETIVRGLQDNCGVRVKNIEILRKDIIRRYDFAVNLLEGQRVKQIQRRGKYMVFAFARRHHLIVHLGMSGRLYSLPETAKANEKHVHMIMHLDKHKKIVYQDARRFGGIWLVHDLDDFFCRMGVEPLGKDFTPEYLAQTLAGRRTAIKNLLLNQRLICGIGNIYADEALFKAGIRPQRPASSLAPPEIESLWQAIRQVLNEGIAARGTTFRDYRDENNQAGTFQHHLAVYGKKGSACICCGSPIIVDTIGGRSSHYCETCQK
ncbi:bifunctional DNA-formamidopyrimidine glycosylase/DNA-(apurinic or apyrimidinic site) lyase [Syntrophomonas palmitatica]|uniref:bifunctional DNA-formamidopyrimidine glycosylase/DNA-(apurinic or apyrimidinic site) lyase n=1 Tax=Syntrophomonas palmitatica TaxID=402877 RepID=UPI0006D2C4A1|nr:bifunctional DNA-formamidopyrimidine glycosylase/DNA-(apurinic or apyrimidinic site) lyase [Syntrophomonas palmitatica]